MNSAAPSVGPTNFVASSTPAATGLGVIEIRSLIASSPIDGFPIDHPRVSSAEILAQLERLRAEGMRVLLLHLETEGGFCDEIGQLVDAVFDFRQAGGKVVAFAGNDRARRGHGEVNSGAPLLLVAADVALMDYQAALHIHGTQQSLLKPVVDSWMVDVYAARTHSSPAELAAIVARWGMRERGADSHFRMDADAALAAGWIDWICSYSTARQVAENVAAGKDMTDGRRGVLSSEEPPRWSALRLPGQSLAASYPAANQTNQGPDNLFPNGTSETNPPSQVQVLNDGSQPEWDYRKNLAGAASFTSSISVATLNVSVVASGALAIGQRVDGAGVLPATYIVSLGTGTGGAGTYGLNQAQTVVSESMTTSGAYAGDWVRELPNGAGAASLSLSVKIPCSPGEFFSMSAQGRYVSTSGTPVFGIAVQFFDQADNFLGGPTQPTALSQPTWFLLSTANFAAVPAPTGTAYMKATIDVSAHTVAQFDSIVLRRVTQPQHIAPGASGQGLVSTAAGATVWAGDSAWTNATLINSWADFGGGNPTPGFRKDAGGRVYLRGAIKSGTIGTIAFVLPGVPNYRPTGTLNPVCASNNALGIAVIDNVGNVTPVVGSNVWFDLSGISFSTI